MYTAVALDVLMDCSVYLRRVILTRALHLFWVCFHMFPACMHAVLGLCRMMLSLVCIKCHATSCRWVSVFELLDDGKIGVGSLGSTHVITSIHVPPIKPTNVFWSYKVRLCLATNCGPHCITIM